MTTKKLSTESSRMRIIFPATSCIFLVATRMSSGQYDVSGSLNFALLLLCCLECGRYILDRENGSHPRNDREEPTYGLRLHILDIYKRDK